MWRAYCLARDLMPTPEVPPVNRLPGRHTALLALASVLVVLSSITYSAEDVGVPNGVASTAAPSRATDPSRDADLRDLRAVHFRMPLRFERVPQLERAATDFVARGAGYAVHLSGGHATIALRSDAAAQAETIRMRLVGSRSRVQGTASVELGGRSHHVVGKDPSEWKMNVPAYRMVMYRGVYPGVDLAFYGNQHQLEYDFYLAPGARPAAIALAIEGAEDVRIDDRGNLVIATRAGTLTHRAPTIFQVVNGTRRPVEGGYAIRADGHVGFSVGPYDRRYPLVIDPILSYMAAAPTVAVTVPR